MTQLSDSGQAGALSNPLVSCGPFQSFQSGTDQFGQVCDRLEDTLSLKGLSFRKAYVEGRLLIGVVQGRGPSVSDADEVSLVSVWRFNGQIVPDLGELPPFVVNMHGSHPHEAKGRDQSTMFVSAVEKMESVEVSFPTFEGLYVIEDGVDNFVVRRDTKRFMSIDGTFCSLFGPVKREVAMAGWGAAIGADQLAICVVQASPEVVDGVTQHCLSMAGQVGNARLPRVVLILSDQTARVCLNEMPENLIEVSDVMFGPFGL